MEKIRAAVVTVSDRVSRGEAEDLGGARLAELLEASGKVHVATRATVADERLPIRDLLLNLAVHHDLVVTTGGTGLAPRDVTPEATLDVIEKRLLGMEEAMRAEGRSRTPLADLSRAVVGTLGHSLIVNLPGSPRGIEDGIRVILPAVAHAVEVLRGKAGDCASARAAHEVPR